MNVEPTKHATRQLLKGSANTTRLHNSDAITHATPDALLLQAEADLADLSSETTGAGGLEATLFMSVETVEQLLVQELQAELQAEKNGIQTANSSSAKAVIRRIALEVERICQKSDRIQASGQIHSWQLALARHRLQKCLSYYWLGSRQGRVELHSHLSMMVYRHIAPAGSQLGFQSRYSLTEDFLQGFYIESLKFLRREHQLAADYQPRTRVELAEYMAFTEQYAKRRINLPGRRSQQLIVLRAQGFANRQPTDTTMDIELAMESARGEDAELYSRSPAVQQVREQMVAEAIDPAEAVMRERVIAELIQYLESQGQSECVDYLCLKLQDLSVPEMDAILNLTPRQRDYLQQRFKYHVEKFSRSHHWQLVHQWLGADLDQKLGMSDVQWQEFWGQLSPAQQQLLQLKHDQVEDHAIAQALKCTAKQLQKRWYQLLDDAWQFRNRTS